MIESDVRLIFCIYIGSSLEVNFIFYKSIGLKSYFLYLHQSYGAFFVFPSSVRMIVENLGLCLKNSC